MLRLTEHQWSNPVFLTSEQQRRIKQLFAADLEPAADGRVLVRPSYRVGWANIDGLRVTVAPKLPIRRILHLVAETADPYKWLDLDVRSLPTESVHDSLAALFARACLSTFQRGLLRSYHREDQQLRFVRGRMNIPKYLRSPQALPIPVRADVFDDNVIENQILRATLRLLLISGSLSSDTRRSVSRAYRAVEHVAHLNDPLSTINSIAWDRQNAHYESIIQFALLVLSGGSITHARGALSHSGFYLDMPSLIEQWVRVQLRNAWGLSLPQMRDSWQNQLWLDASRRVHLIPDLAVRMNGEWNFVGDVKYKPLRESAANQDDVYQLLAYLMATDLNDGVLIYAGVEGTDETLRISQGDKTMHIVSVSLDAANPRAELLTKLSGFAPNKK